MHSPLLGILEMFNQSHQEQTAKTCTKVRPEAWERAVRVVQHPELSKVSFPRRSFHKAVSPKCARSVERLLAARAKEVLKLCTHSAELAHVDILDRTNRKVEDAAWGQLLHRNRGSALSREAGVPTLERDLRAALQRPALSPKAMAKKNIKRSGPSICCKFAQVVEKPKLEPHLQIGTIVSCKGTVRHVIVFAKHTSITTLSSICDHCIGCSVASSATFGIVTLPQEVDNHGRISQTVLYAEAQRLDMCPSSQTRFYDKCILDQICKICFTENCQICL